jgi:hypothetical protein
VDVPIAYLDESGHVTQPGYYGVAGFIGLDSQWTDFNRLWLGAMASVGINDLHMREFSAQQKAFKEWDEPRRQRLMAGAISAIKKTRLTAVGAAMSTEAFNSLNEVQKSRMQDPYYCCLQEVLYGFALVGDDAPPDDTTTIIASRQDEYRGKAKKMWKVLRTLGWPYSRCDYLLYRDMRGIPGLQAADLLTYEMTKELSNQDNRPNAPRRWAFDQILRDQASRRSLFIKFLTKDYIVAQANLQFDEIGRQVVERNMQESARIYRESKGIRLVPPSGEAEENGL